MTQICTCIAPKSIEVINQTAGRIHCSLCHRGVDVFKNSNGKWESGAEKMARMAVRQICKKCQKEFTHLMDHRGVARAFCDDCLAENQREADSKKSLIRQSSARKNLASPWRRHINLPKSKQETA